MDDLNVLADDEKEMQKVVNKCISSNSKAKDWIIVDNVHCFSKDNCDLKCMYLLTHLFIINID